jgi:hypothetical protein
MVWKHLTMIGAILLYVSSNQGFAQTRGGWISIISSNTEVLLNRKSGRFEKKKTENIGDQSFMRD